MTLRRFPWKAPRLTDNSYKLFVAEPSTPERTSKSTSDLPSANSDSASTTSHHHHHHHRDSSKPLSEPASLNESKAPEVHVQPEASTENAPPPKQEVIKGPWRLLRLLPRETRDIIGKMLIVDPKKRATLADMFADPWISGTPYCTQDSTGDNIFRPAPGHTHTLQASDAKQDVVPSKK
jgi:serine/threonine protein kinase